jgi:hypothetical protein
MKDYLEIVKKAFSGKQSLGGDFVVISEYMREMGKRKPLIAGSDVIEWIGHVMDGNTPYEEIYVKIKGY